jgi:hypothetical protein
MITGQLDETRSSYKELAPLVLSLFALTQDFTALHAVTSMHAFRILIEHAPQQDTSASRKSLFVALAAAYVSIRAPLVTPLEIPTQDDSWDALTAKAIQSDDDHIPKIVFTCREEYSYSGNPSYLEAAKRYLDKFGR